MGIPYMNQCVVDLSVVTPIFNEEINIEPLYQRLKAVLSKLGLSYEIIFVDDGSLDQSVSILKKINISDPHVKILSFSRNFGHQIALTAGMRHSCGRAVLTMDSDLQDQPEDIPKYVQKWREGYECIYAIRVKRDESFIRQSLFKLFYRVFNAFSDVSIPVDAGDFCLLDRKVVNAMMQMRERSRFLRGMRAWAGFKHVGVEQCRPSRMKGSSIKHGFKKLFNIGFDGLISFSYLPLRFASVSGIIISTGGFLFGVKILYEKIFTLKPIIGWSSLMITIVFFSGINLLFLGLVGEYICRIFDETKDRPLYFLNETIGFNKEINAIEASQQYGLEPLRD